jgi:putative ABC transport system permease protein
MDYKELISESFSTLTLNKIRTALAMLGVIIGIGSVIALISLGQSSQKSVQDQIKSLGSNLLTVMPGAADSGGVRGAVGGRTSLTYEDAKAIKNSSEITTVKNVAPEFSRNSQVTAGRNNTNTQIVGVTAEYSKVRNLPVSIGSFLTEQHIEGLAKVAVLGPQTVTDLFGENADPIGKIVRINGISFSVIGVTQSKGGSGFMNQDDRVFVPLTTAQKILYGADYVSSISIEAIDEKNMSQARDQVGYFLLKKHRINDPLAADFSIMSQEDILGTATQVTATFTTLLSGIAAISLVVGGIGIMNIMLVTVTERTREIGLRKSLGAKKKIITAQFLTEAIIITFTGGLVGILVGSAVSYLLSKYMQLPFTLAFTSIILAFGVSAAIGIIFGYYPARKAANLQPIDALRYE